MRTRIIASLCSLLLWVPAFAQDQQGTDDQQGMDDQQNAGDNAETGGADVAPDSGDQVRTTPPPGSGEAVAPGEVHTVVSGDTLWDLSQQYLGSPWYWPKVWSYNPEIANPHWIYPGNKIRFFPAGEEVPSRVEVGTAPQELPGEEGVEAPEAFGEETGTVQATGQIGYVPKNSTAVLLNGFATSREIDEAGRIVGSFSETQLLSYPDTVYLQFKNPGSVKVGDSYVIFHTTNPITHPVTRDRIGYLTSLVGKVKVLGVSRDMVKAQITDTWNEITRGDLIGPANEDFLLHVAPRPNEKAVDGTLVEMMVPYLTIVGEHQLVIIDRGSSDGVQVGNTFTVVRQQDLGGNFMEPQKGQQHKWPEEAVGACMVVDVKDRFNTCLMTRSIREILRGDRVVMRVGAVSTASR